MQKMLEAIRKELFGRFEVRKTVKQKAAFAEWACDTARALGYDVQVERSGKWFDTRNIVIGDLSKARVLITAHYDTCAWLPFCNAYTPECWPIILFTQLILPMAVFTAMGYGAGRLMRLLELSGIFAALGAAALCVIGGGLILYLMLFGPANPHTANDNTSGVAFVLLAMHAFKGRMDIAYVLFDNEEIGLLGSAAFVKAHTALAQRAFVLNMDCVSDGDLLMLVGSRRANASAQGKRLQKALGEIAPQFGKRSKVGTAPKTLYPSDQLLFPRGAAFAAFKGKRILYMDRIHSAKDNVFDDTNLLCLLRVTEEAFRPSVGNSRDSESKEL